MNELRLPVSGPVELSALHRELKAQVPAVDSLGLEQQEVIVRTDTAFTPADRAALQAVLAAHDPAQVKTSRAAREQEKQALIKQSPTQLTVAERVERLERFLGLDQEVKER